MTTNKDDSPSGVIDETNYRETAQKAIERYRGAGRIFDAFVWSTIIRLYEAALEEKKQP